MSNHKPPKQTQFNSCMTGVNPARTHGVGIWGNRRVVMGIRIDEKLKKEATKVLKAIYGSTCRGIETYLAGLVATYHTQQIDGVNPSNTRIDIGTIRIERNIKTRRKMVVAEEEEVQEIRGSYAEKLQQDKDAELERIFSGAMAQWSNLKPEAKAYHLRNAEANCHLRSAKLLLDLAKPDVLEAPQ